MCTLSKWHGNYLSGLSLPGKCLMTLCNQITNQIKFISECECLQAMTSLFYKELGLIILFYYIWHDLFHCTALMSRLAFSALPAHTPGISLFVLCAPHTQREERSGLEQDLPYETAFLKTAAPGS